MKTNRDLVLIILKYLAAAVLYSSWFYLVLAGKADATTFVTFLGTSLGGIGIYHAALKNPNDQSLSPLDFTPKGDQK